MSELRVQIVDYGLGNLFSIRQACLQSGITAEISPTAESLGEVDGIILPGVARIWPCDGDVAIAGAD
ncbi:MAG UNVERIFIED_CONTAM: hypothetical protein LVR18_17865 [Planctomycetaceae bacterium]|jgi:glutamine amidotransferase